MVNLVTHSFVWVKYFLYKICWIFLDTTVEDNKFKTFNCFDVSSNDRLLTAGTDTIGGDAFILFWDTRKQNVLGGYWESHTDDITQV